MRLENYYVLSTIKKEEKECEEEQFNTLEEITNNLELEDLEELAEQYDSIEISHIYECYCGDWEDETIFEFKNGEVLVDEENLIKKAQEDKKTECKIETTDKKNTRLKILLNNALILLNETGIGGKDFKEFAESELGMTSEEYTEITGEE